MFYRGEIMGFSLEYDRLAEEEILSDADLNGDEFVDEELEDELPGDETIDAPEESEESADEESYQFEIDGETKALTKEQLLSVVNGKPAVTDDEDFNAYKQVKPLIENIKTDPTLQKYVQYRANGYGDGDVIDGMFLQRHPELQGLINDYYSGRTPQAQQQEETIPEFDTVEEEVAWHVDRRVQAKLNELVPQLTQLQQKQSTYEEQQVRQNVRLNNDAVMMKAFSEFGHDGNAMGKEELSSVAEAMQDLYPGVDFSKAAITPAQAKRIVQASLGRKTSASKTPDTKTYIKNASLPKINPVSPSKQSSKKSVMDKIDGMTRTDRMQRATLLFGN